MSRDAQDVHGPGLELHGEQHIRALDKLGADVQEVTGQDARCLGGQERQTLPRVRISGAGMRRRCGKPTERGAEFPGQDGVPRKRMPTAAR